MSKTSIEDYNFELPPELIASYPNENRTSSKLLHFNRNNHTINHRVFSDLIDEFEAGDVIVMNDTKVIPARLQLQKQTGGKIEILFNENLSNERFTVIYKSNRVPAMNSVIFFRDFKFRIENIVSNIITLTNLNNSHIFNILEKYGEVPLPRYINRHVESSDREKYQTVFANHQGSVAAPTAGLHFSLDMINQLIKRGIILKYITLHISYNTFKSIKNINYTKHEIGHEKFSIDKDVFNCIDKAKSDKKRVIAVGTTVTRVLEHCYSKNIHNSTSDYTSLFIYPGYKFKIVDNLITNFHLPKSSLLLLVSALIGKDKVISLYSEAIKNKYRFFSYGDCMFIDNSL